MFSAAEKGSNLIRQKYQILPGSGPVSRSHKQLQLPLQPKMKQGQFPAACSHEWLAKDRPRAFCFSLRAFQRI